MSLNLLQPYLTAISAIVSIATLGFILNLVKAVRDSAQDRLAVQEERLKRAAEDQQRTEKWADREKAALKEELDKAKTELDSLLKAEGLDLASLTLGKQLSETAGLVRTTAENLVQEMQNKLAQLSQINDGANPTPNPDLELSLAMGAMSYGSFADAAAHFDTYSRVEKQSWQTSLTRGVAHANARRGYASNLASLRAYNDAVALAPSDVSDNLRARIFMYRGAILKRLGRLSEAEADLKIALSLADADYELTDIHYNLACIHAMRGDKANMISEIEIIKHNKKYLRAVRSHVADYFAKYALDSDFKKIVGIK